MEKCTWVNIDYCFDFWVCFGHFCFDGEEWFGCVNVIVDAQGLRLSLSL